MLCMNSQLEYFQIYERNILILYDNTFPIYLSKNPILHSRAKNIEIKQYFIRDYVQKGILNFKFIDTDHPKKMNQFSFIANNQLHDECLCHTFFHLHAI